MVRHDDRRRAQVGIGTLIVFVSMVLVAAIAAGVLIDSAGYLQSESEATGEKSSQQVTNRVHVISVSGDVNSDGEIPSIDVDLAKAPGAGDINVSNLTVLWIGPGGAADLTSERQFGWSIWPISGTTPVLTAESDVLQLTLSLSSAPIIRTLKPGETAVLILTTPSGGRTRLTIRAPDSLQGEEAVAL